jgi:hypothetical protein
MNPLIQNNTSEPPGNLPRRASYLLLGAIATIILVASFFSGQSAKKRECSASAGNGEGVQPLR